MSVDKGYVNPDVLVSTDWVAQHKDDPNIVIVESDEDVLLYELGHVPGAVKIDWHLDLNDPVERDYVSGEGFADALAGAGTAVLVAPPGAGDVVDMDAVEDLARLDDAAGGPLVEIDQRVAAGSVDAGDAADAHRQGSSPAPVPVAPGPRGTPARSGR